LVTASAAGTVFLVGAGPGDPGLVTQRALELIAEADAIVYDRLVPSRLLEHARPEAELVYAGKQPGDAGLGQEQINRMLIDLARDGKQVVRLKGGDPFVFGRGGEEAIALDAAGVPFDIVPGISSAVAAPALAGIPVTHRGLAAAFLVVSGHDEDAFAASIGQLAPNGLTLVVLMGVGRRAPLASRLIDRGWSRETPAAIVADASLPQQQVWRGTLDDLASDRAQLEGDGPATIVVGAVAALALITGDAPVAIAERARKRS
jgi:uroporphyrin-III C-methyltransferase / precorrin-2 dehydrogenase / sirohydrochlorin ferrochelatase